MIHKKRVIRKLGYSLIIIGIFLIIIQPGSLTGAVIDLTSVIGRIWFFVGLGLVIGGIGITILSREYSRVDLEYLIDRVQNRFDNVVLDTGGVIAAHNEGKLNELLDVSKNSFGQVFIPNEVINELSKRKEMREVVMMLKQRKNQFSFSEISPYTTMAKDYLKLTNKARTFYDFSPFVKEVKIVLGRPKNRAIEDKELIIEDIKDKYRDRIEDFDERFEKLISKTNVKNIDGHQKYIILNQALDTSYKPSEADAEVLAYGLYACRQGNTKIRKKIKERFGNRKIPKEALRKGRDVKLYSTDSDLHDALGFMESGYEGIDPSGEKEKLCLNPDHDFSKYINYKEPTRNIRQEIEDNALEYRKSKVA